MNDFICRSQHTGAHFLFIHLPFLIHLPQLTSITLIMPSINSNRITFSLNNSMVFVGCFCAWWSEDITCLPYLIDGLCNHCSTQKSCQLVCFLSSVSYTELNFMGTPHFCFYIPHICARWNEDIACLQHVGGWCNHCRTKNDSVQSTLCVCSCVCACVCVRVCVCDVMPN